MPRPIEAVINLAAARNNLAVARRHAAGAKVFAVVKANAYGHGIERVLPAFADADGYAVVELDAALRIRASGIDKPILMLEGFFDQSELLTMAKHAFSVVVHEHSQVQRLRSATLPQPVDVFLKVNTGMNRLGFAVVEAAGVYRDLSQCASVSRLLAMTHFADADDTRGVDWQLRPLAELATNLGIDFCAANSAALLRYPQSVGSWVRPGIMLYGSSPFADVAARELGLQPVMTLRSRIIGVQNLKLGDRVGYGGAFVAERPTRIGVVACGYADGYPRHAPSGTPVLVNGHRSVTLGRVAMDLLCVDLTGLPDANIGTEVVLWGDGMSIDEVAASAGTLGYELMAKVTARVPFVVSN